MIRFSESMTFFSSFSKALILKINVSWIINFNWWISNLWACSLMLNEFNFKMRIEIIFVFILNSFCLRSVKNSFSLLFLVWRCSKYEIKSSQTFKSLSIQFPRFNQRVSTYFLSLRIGFWLTDCLSFNKACLWGECWNMSVYFEKKK